jgi:hypothetical protein
MRRRDTFAVVVLARDGIELASWRLAGLRSPGLCVVDQLARLQVSARRHGCSIRLRDVSPELVELLDLVGLRVEVGGEPEGGEEVLGVEEVVVPDDPVT